MSKKKKSSPLVEVINLKTGKFSQERIAYEEIHVLKRARSQLSNNQIARLTKIYPLTGSLLNDTLNDWIKGFTYDFHPEREILIWERIAYVLTKHCNQYNLASDERRNTLVRLIDLTNGVECEDRLSKELVLLWKKAAKENLELGKSKSLNPISDKNLTDKEISINPWHNIDHVKLVSAYQKSIKSLELSLEEKDDVLVRLVRLMEGEEPQDFLSKKLQYLLTTNNKDSKGRKGQSKFRQALIKVYQGTCAITGCDEESALEAAHIIRYSDAGTNHPSNGMLLRADIHTLFDKSLLSVNPQNYEVIVSPKLLGTSYTELNATVRTILNRQRWNAGFSIITEANTNGGMRVSASASKNVRSIDNKRSSFISDINHS